MMKFCKFNFIKMFFENIEIDLSSNEYRDKGGNTLLHTTIIFNRPPLFLNELLELPSFEALVYKMNDTGFPPSRYANSNVQTVLLAVGEKHANSSCGKYNDRLSLFQSSVCAEQEAASQTERNVPIVCEV